jgi:hypothetical protein
MADCCRKRATTCDGGEDPVRFLCKQALARLVVFAHQGLGNRLAALGRPNLDDLRVAYRRLRMLAPWGAASGGTCHLRLTCDELEILRRIGLFVCS